MIFSSVQMENGKILEGEKIGELVMDIINKFSDADLSCDEAKIVLKKAESILGEFSLVQKIY